MPWRLPPKRRCAMPSGEANASDVVVPGRGAAADQESKDAIEERVSAWGPAVLGGGGAQHHPSPVRCRMLCRRRRRPNGARARVLTLMESEKMVAELLAEAAEVYRNDEIAYDLRRMHLVHEGMEDEGSSLVGARRPILEGFSERPSDYGKPTPW